jgi:Zn-finger nucleic acid-binding protein
MSAGTRSARGRNLARTSYVGRNDEKECDDMQCPTDGTTLTMSERSGIEIDYCPECRGVWLDRGELDKIIERSHQIASAPTAAPAAPAAPPPPTHAYPQHPPPGYDPYYYKKKKKGGWLEDIFD